LTAFSSDRLVALLPLCVEDKKVLKIPVKKLAFIGSEIGGAAYLDVLAAPGDRSAATAAFLEFLYRDEKIDLFELEGIGADSSLLTAIASPGKSTGLTMRVVPQDVCQVAVIPEAEKGTFLNQIFNETARKKIRRLERLGGFLFQRITDPAEIGQAFRHFVRLHDNNWSERGGSDVTGSQQLLDFHLKVVATCSEADTVFFDELWAQGNCIASLYGFSRDGTYFYYSSGYDERLSKFSPMSTLYNLSIRNGLENNINTFDFLRGNYSYKAHWINAENQLVTVRLGRRNVPAAIHETVNWLQDNGKSLLTIVLPVDVLRQLKERHRKWKRKLTQAAAEAQPQPQHEVL
jgi:CelD/BcsL family acetyltransferase involved in cellulose biosynthesis